jgi:hypothetical protein
MADSGGAITVVDGATNTPERVLTGASGAMAIAVNQVTGEVYAAGPAITVLTPNVQTTVPMNLATQGVTDAMTISGQAVFATSNASPSFTGTVQSNFTPTAPAPTAFYYQLDTVEGTWQAATQTSSNGANPADYSFSLSSVPYGMHTIYTYATYGDEATYGGGKSGTGSTPQISNVAAYQFAVLPGTP